jgi:pilus assembly protein CpaE
MPAQDKIRVLIVDDIDETRENIQRLLQFDLNIEVVGTARNGKEAIQTAQQIKPDVVIMDINMPDMDGITATEAIRQKIPYAQVVILSVQADPNYMRRAMLAGARDFLTKPPSIDELTAAINRAGAMASEERTKAATTAPSGSANPSTPGASAAAAHGKIIVIYSPKGGTGCTTISTNMALAIKNDKNNVLLVDASIQYGDVCAFLNEKPKNSLLDLIPRVDELEVEIIEDVTTKHAASGIHILAAPSRPELAERVDSEQFGKLLLYLKQIYNYIIIDTSSFLNDVVGSALELADLIILVTTQDIPSIKNSVQFLNLADASGIRRESILFVMNQFDKKYSISPEKVKESLKQDIVATIPFDDRLVKTAINRGIPLLIDNRAHPISKAILSLAEIIQQHLKAKEEKAPPSPR